MANHKRRNGRSHFTVAQNLKGLLSNSDDDTFLGTVTANLTGSKYNIWDQGYRNKPRSKQPKPPLAVVEYVPTIASCTGTHRTIKAYIPKNTNQVTFIFNNMIDNHTHIVFNNNNNKIGVQVQHIKGLPMNWEGKMDKVHQLVSRDPLYNKVGGEEVSLSFIVSQPCILIFIHLYSILFLHQSTKQFELDYRDKGRPGLGIQRSVKNFQLTLEVSSLKSEFVFML